MPISNTISSKSAFNPWPSLRLGVAVMPRNNGPLGFELHESEVVVNPLERVRYADVRFVLNNGVEYSDGSIRLIRSTSPCAPAWAQKPPRRCP